MKAVKIIVFFICINCSNLFGQHNIGLRLGVNRFDLQVGAQYSYQLQQVDLMAGFDVGFNRTILQQQLFPKVYIGTAYDFLKNEKWALGPQVVTDFFYLNFNKEVNRPSCWLDVLGGIRFSYGQKWKVVAQAGIGPAWLWDYSLNESKYYSTYFTNYEYSVGCAYSF